MTPPELNYDTHDKELLAIFEAFHHWHHYLEGSATPIDVVTDHKNLEYLFLLQGPHLLPGSLVGVPLTVHPFDPLPPWASRS